jgi:hypothetical protein
MTPNLQFVDTGKVRLKNKPDPDLYPPYSDDYNRDMKRWVEENKSCRYPHCVCIGDECNAVKFNLKNGTVVYPNVMF